MKVRTIIEDRFPRGNLRTSSRKVFVAIMFTAEVAFNTILPFAFGFYFAKTGKLYLLPFFIINILFSIKTTIKGKQIYIELMRRF